jgi:TPR repeat protein
VQFYERAASEGDADGANNYGRCLEYGKGVDINPIQAANYYKIASDLGHSDGSNNYGMCFERGFGVNRDPEQAANLYRTAASMNHPDGSNNYGHCLEHGIAIKQDISEARHYYKLAMDLGHPEAVTNYCRRCRLLGEWSVNQRRPTLEHLDNDHLKQIRPSDLQHNLQILPQSHSAETVRLVKVSQPNREYFVKEIERFTKLRHPCILAFHDLSFPDISGNI